jgi:triosephosphate isomerase
MTAAKTSRRFIVAGNWKMNLGAPMAAAELARETRRLCVQHRGVTVVSAPPFPGIAAVVGVYEGTDLSVAGQTCHFESKGAFTGEVAPAMLRDAGCRYVIVGHSERRALFGETDDVIARKAQAALEAGLRPIVCVGETLEQRDAGTTLEVVRTQLTGGLGERSAESMALVVLAYEPVWAIGTGRTATAAQAQEVHAYLRSEAAGLWGEETAAGLRILYGGSVKPGNAAELFAQEDVDGGLIGGASLDAESFAAIVKAAAQAG